MTETPQPSTFNQGMISPAEASEELQRRTLVQLIKEEKIEEARQFLARAPDPRALAQSRSPESGQVPLFQAVQVKTPARALEMVVALLDAGAAVSPVDAYGQTPLFYVCRDGNLPLLTLFLERGAAINEEDSMKQTPLFYAAREGHADFIRAMLERGAEADHLDKIRETALFYAARDGKLEACRALLAAGANVNTIDDKKQTALYFAMKNKNDAVVEFLLASGAVRTKDGRISKNDQLRLQKREAEGEGEAQPAQAAAQKKKKGAAAEEQRLSYRLVYADAALRTRELSEADFLRLAELCPQLARVLQNPELLASDAQLRELAEREKWQQTALAIIDALRKHKSARVFNEPVDWVKLKIPDYPRIVQTPMDLGTVRRKLALNVYRNAGQFVADVGLVFSNCRLYNGTESLVGKMGVEVGREWEQLLQSHGLLERFGEEAEGADCLDAQASLEGFFGELAAAEGPAAPPSAQKADAVEGVS